MIKQQIFLILGILLFLSILSTTLLLRMNALRDTHLAQTEEMLARETALIAQTITLDIKQGKPATLPKNFGDIRITLINPQNYVIAETAENPKVLAIHDNRDEIIAAQQGTPSNISRFSQTLNQHMFYHAHPIITPQGTYVLRTAITTEALHANINTIRNILFISILIIAISLLTLFIYLTYRVYNPLQKSLRKQKEIQSTLNSRLQVQLQEKETIP